MRNIIKSIKTILAITIFLAFAGLCAAADKESTLNTKSPFDVTADHLEATKEMIIFTGNVTVTHPEMTITANKVELSYDSKGEGNSIKSITAEGNATLVEKQKQREAKADKIIYDKNAGTIMLTGNPEVKQGSNTVKGEEIKISLTDDKVSVKGGVRAVINPQNIK